MINSKYFYPDGAIYEGEWKEGQLYGRGKMTYSDGTIYEGEWKKSQQHGQGKMTYSDGSIYEGEWKEGQLHGQGKYFYPDGAIYEGEWKEGQLYGRGKMTYSDGTIYEGEWKKSQQHGQGKMTYSDGSIYEGEWKEGQLHGQGKMTYPDGSIYEGEWKEDKRHGQGKMTYSDGSIYEGEWKEGQLHGQHTAYIYENGKIISSYDLSSIPEESLKYTEAKCQETVPLSSKEFTISEITQTEQSSEIILYLQQIKERFGTIIFEDGRKTLALLHDLAPQLKKECRRIKIAYESKAVAILLSEKDKASVVNKAVRIMIDYSDMIEDIARETILVLYQVIK